MLVSSFRNVLHVLRIVKVVSDLKSINVWTVTMGTNWIILSVSWNAHPTDIQINHNIVIGVTSHVDSAGDLLISNADNVTMTVMFTEENAMILVLQLLT